MEQLRAKSKRALTLFLAIVMILTSLPLDVLAEVKVNHNDIAGDKDKFVNELKPVKPAKLGANEKAEDFIKNPAQPVIYTLRTDYKVQRGEKYDVDYQPYIASVGAAATQAEKDKVNKTIDLPDLAGYDEPQENFIINYDTVKNAADGKGQTGNDTNGIRYQANEDFRYKAKANQITIKHVFQDLEDFTKYTNPDGSVGETGEIITTQNGNTGSTMEVSPLTENDPRRKGFVPEADSITMQVPENAENFILEYRYSRAHYDVTFDTAGGTALPARTLYYGQVIPKIGDEAIPTKVGGEFLGWKPSVDIKDKNGKTYKANEIIAVGTSGAIKNLDADLIMPASKLTFTAVWKDKEKANYAVQFWAEKADHADGASLLDKYDYIGTRVYKDQDTGSRPDLDNEPVKDIVFPDLNQARLKKIWAGARFNRTKNLYLNKFYVYNQDLTHEQNADPANVNLVKSVDSTGKTIYNIYYDRQVYDLYFTKSNVQPEKNTIYPEIWKYDEKKGEAVKVGEPGNLYHYKARFNEMMYKWPNDAKQTKGFTPGYQSFGWGPNYTVPNWPLYLDTPPYRLNADEFLDMANYTSWGGYTKHIDKGDGTTIDLDPLDFTTLSFGIKQDHPSIPHHMDFWMDGFKKGETIIRYDLVRTKADTAALYYGHRYPIVTGFTPYGYDPKKQWPSIKEGQQEDGRVDGDRIDGLNDERDEITPNNCGTYYNNNGIKLPIGQLDFIAHFFSDDDGFGDVKTGGQEFTENGYLQFHYKRKKYPLRFNYDPSKIKDDSEFNSTNQLDTFYEFPLKVLSPDLVDSNLDREDREYFKEDPKNLLDNPENLKQLGLTDLVFNDPNDNNKLKVKRPDNLSAQMVFKGWALDPAGLKLIWENPGEKMPFHPLNLYAKWGEPDYKWKVTFDPNGGNLRNIKDENLTTSRKKIQVGDIGQEEINTYAKKEKNDGDKQVFTVIQRQKLVEPKYKPTRKGYDFMGWEVIRYKKDANTGDYTDEIDTSYRDTYKVPELYSFGNDVVSPIYLKAIWVPNDRVDVKVEHHILNLDLSEETKMIPETLPGKRANYLVATTGDKQSDKYILVTHEELNEKLTGDLKTLYDEYNKRVGANNTFFQQFRVEPEKKLNPETNQVEDNPDVKNNVFHFFYKPFRTRQYKVNYIDERFKGQANEKDGAIIDQELVENGNRHYDARNYRPIPGWVLAKDEKPQQQLFFDVNEDTNEFLGINKTGKDEITFYYKDVRVIEVPNKDDPVPDGYVRVIFKAEKGGSFGKDAEGKDITELNYDVIKGLKSDLLPVPKELAEGETADKDKYYITPDDGKKFTKWDNSPLLNDNTIINENHSFTAYFEWSGLSATGLVRTEAFKDPKNTWTNDFAPTIDQLKAQLVWREKDEVKPLPDGTVIKLFDKDGNELTTNDQVYDLVNEKKAADTDELVRTVNVKAKVTFKDGKEPQELTIPITVYKNVYEALNKDGDKPLFLKEAEGKDAKDGGLKDVTGNYVKVIVQPTEKNTNKDAKIYYVNPKAWVNIPEVEWSEADKDKYDFLKWTADKDAQNENGVFDFSKRHKFTDEETLIKPVFTNDVVEQKEGEDKPKVPDNFVKVIVKTTDKATDETAFEKTFWVNPTKEVAIDVTNPTGKENQKFTFDGLGEKDVNYIFKEWQKVQTGEADDSLTKVDPAVKIDLAKNQYTDKVTVIEAAYKKSIQAESIAKPLKTTKLDTPQGKEITNDDLIKQITPQEGKEIESIEVISKPDGKTVGNEPAKVIVKYKDGTTQGTNDDPVVIPVEVHKNIIPEAPGGLRPKDAMDNYVKVIFKAEVGGTLSGDTVYYVSPEVEVDLTETAKAITKTPSVGYFVNGEKWTNKDKKTLKGTFTDSETEFIFTFDKSKDIVEKTNDPNQVIPEGYVTVIFKTEAEAKGTVNGSVEKIYYVNPKAGIKLGKTAGDKILVVPTPKANKNYVFDKWQEAIDENTPITSERVHVAIFTSGQVILTYDKGGDDVTGDAPEIVTVNVGTTVRLAGKGILAKPNATFAGWKLNGEDDKIYQPGDQVKLEKSRTATAQWINDKNIIPYNPKDPITRPKGYVRVTFEADPGLKLTEEKAYYVKANKGITLGNAKLVKPAYEAQTGYKFEKWDKEDSLEITEDILVTAKATKLDTVIPATGAPNEKPEGYKEVTFVIKTREEAKGSITGVSKFYVNPTEYVTINPPATKAETGYKFGSWDKDATIPTVYDKDTTITGSFNGLKDIIPKINPDGTENKQPAGYKMVTFVIDPATGGKIADKEVTVYYVNPSKDVTVPQPKTKAETGYEFEKWDTNTTTAKKYDKDTTVKGNFKKLDEIIPSTDGNGKTNAKPDGYVTVTFEKGANGKLITGQTRYYVNPKANPAKTLANITKPIVTPETGYKADGWDKEDTQTITGDLTVIAKYKELDDVLPKTKNDGTENKQPDGYITVTFEKGANGELKGNTVFYVNPNKAVVFEDKAPTIKPNTGYVSAGWDTTINKAIQYKDGDKITALYNDPGNISKTEVSGYVKVEFKPGTNGSLTGTTMYWVKPEVEVNVPAPTVTPNVGYKFDKWNKDLTVNLQASDSPYEITAGYTSLEDIIPQEKTDGSDKPDKYNIVSFMGDNGTLNGSKTAIRYYVNPNKVVDFTDIVKGFTKKPNFAYTEVGGTWSSNVFKKKFTDMYTVFTFKFQPLQDVIEKIDENTKKPDGYVTVKLIPTDKATDTTEKVFFVNSTKEVTISNTPVGTEFTDANGITYKYTFTGWTVTKGTINSWNNGTINGQFIQETEITAQYSTNVVPGELVPAPVAKKDVVTPIKEEPKPEDLIENKTGLPNGTTFKYTDEGTPDVNNPGKTTAKVEVNYPNGKTVVVEVPITVVDNVVPQTGKDKPLVPESYVKVIVDTTDKAEENTRFVKTFWVKPNVEVTIPGILAPTGKTEIIDGVTKKNNFVKWQLEGTSEKTYDKEVKDTFTAKESKIVAIYEEGKNVEPKAKNDQWIPQGSKPNAKDFINNPYDDSDPNNKDNLPPGTRFEFVGENPDTQTPGTGKETKIKVIYPNGEVKEVPVRYNVTGDVVEQPDPNYPNTKPAVPDNFVKVIVKTTEKATDDITRVFWVNPEKEVTIPVTDPIGKVVTKLDETVDYTWKFTGWDIKLTQQFEKETTITAQYKKDFGGLTPWHPIPEARGGFIYTDLGKQVTNEEYKSQIQLPAGYSFNTGTTFEIVSGTEPNINKTGLYSVKAWVTYPDGSGQEVTILVYVGEARVVPQPLPQPGGTGYNAIYIEKKVEVPAKIKPLHKEVRYMQGFNGYFRPEDGLTRAEAAQILANALVEDGYNYNPNYKISYPDIGNEWYTKAIKITTEANVFAGYDDGLFRPEKKITRAEWVATLRRFQNIAEADGNHMNLSGNHWAKAEIEGAFNEGWLKIYSDGLAKFKADEFIPRQEVAAVSNRAFNRVFDKTYIDRNDKAFINQYKDVNPSMWAYEDILCASNTFVHDEQLYRAHDVKNDKITFNVNLDELEILQDKFQRNPR